MMSIAVLFSAILLTVQARQFDGVEEVVEKFNDYMSANKLQNVTTPDFGYEDAPVFIMCSLKDMSTVYEKGPADITAEPDGSVNITATVGLKEFLFHVQICPFMEQKSFDMTVDDFTMEVGFTLTFNSPACASRWNFLRITKMDNPTFHSSLDKWNGKPVPDELKPDIISHYNKWFVDPQVLKIMDQYVDMCKVVL